MAIAPGPVPGAAEIRVRGRVQGVGFRPTVWRLASELGLAGEVLNDGEGVLIRIRGGEGGIAALLDRLRRDLPPLARIDRIERRALDPESLRVLPAGFRIAESIAGAPHTEIAPDAAVCPACAAEIAAPGERRHRYGFTNCTHCGPRLSIVRGIPYDRRNTSMGAFALCPDCAAEYRDPTDRRFHAEPIACPACGPRLMLLPLADRAEVAGDPVVEAARLIRAGEILAIKGLGGYQLACDAANPLAVTELRRRKHRDRKPLALMARDLDTIRRYCAVSAAEAALLQSAAAPIALLAATGSKQLPDELAPGLDRLGFMLPTTPLHLLLLGELDGPVVMTSGNLSDEPQVTDDVDMAARLGGIGAYALTHNRAIANRVDDSVVRVVLGKPRLLRRARGYAPTPVALPPGFEQAPQILAFGGELKANFCLVKDGRAVLSAHQGDLEHPAAFDDYRKNLALYRELFAHHPAALAADCHPEYLSAKLARQKAAICGLPLIEVQHHHAHVAACLCENARPLAARPVIGIVLDGLGWGDNGTLWGGEFLLADYRDYHRVGSLASVAMPGGAQAAREPWRNLYAHLVRTIGWTELTRRFGKLPTVAALAAQPVGLLDRIIAGDINAPPASSCGRLFDAVAAALDICFARQAYEGEAAMRLEALADAGRLQAIGYRFDRACSPLERGPESLARVGPGLRPDAERDVFVTLDPGPLWHELLCDIAAGAPAEFISTKFHNGLAEGIASTAVDLALAHGIDTVALSGGCFQNAVLFAETSRLLAAAGVTVLSHAAVPANDGGLALGQAAVAAARLLSGEASCA